MLKDYKLKYFIRYDADSQVDYEKCVSWIRCLSFEDAWNKAISFVEEIRTSPNVMSVTITSLKWKER